MVGRSGCGKHVVQRANELASESEDWNVLEIRNLCNECSRAFDITYIARQNAKIRRAMRANCKYLRVEDIDFKLAQWTTDNAFKALRET
jgi:hypothetical protein